MNLLLVCWALPALITALSLLAVSRYCLKQTPDMMYEGDMTIIILGSLLYPIVVFGAIAYGMQVLFEYIRDFLHELDSDTLNAISSFLTKERSLWK